MTNEQSHADQAKASLEAGEPLASIAHSLIGLNQLLGHMMRTTRYGTSWHETSEPDLTMGRDAPLD